MDKQSNISRAVIKRLPRYYRYLNDIKKSGIARISSKELAERMGLTASQIRQDLNCFGGFGQQGYGYNIDTLTAELREILGINKNKSAIVIGVGNIGKALINNFDFSRNGFDIIASFDADESLIGTTINSVEVLDIKGLGAFLSKNKADLAVLTIPKNVAQPIADVLVGNEIKGIWNFTNADLKVPDDKVSIESVHFSDSLMTLCYFIKDKE